MANTAEKDSSKLIRLSEHRRRLTNRARRSLNGKPGPHLAAESETIWLARTLLITGAAGLSAALFGSFGLWSAGERGSIPLFAPLPSPLFLTAAAFNAGWRLVRGETGVMPHVGLAGGALIALALADIGEILSRSGTLELDSTARLAILALGIAVVVGVWAASFSMRRRQGETS